MKLLLGVACVFVLFCASNLESAVIGESEVVRIFGIHAKTLRNEIESNTCVPLGREGFPLDAKIKRRVFGKADLVTVAEYSNKIKSLGDDLESLMCAKNLLRKNERELKRQRAKQSAFLQERTDHDLAEIDQNIGRVTYVINSRKSLIKALRGAYATKRYAEIVIVK